LTMFRDTGYWGGKKKVRGMERGLVKNFTAKPRGEKTFFSTGKKRNEEGAG